MSDIPRKVVSIVSDRLVKEFSPPNCPKCGKVLDHIGEIEYNTYVFNKDTGRYDEDRMPTTCCPYCAHDLGCTEEFWNGACNFQA